MMQKASRKFVFFCISIYNNEAEWSKTRKNDAKDLVNKSDISKNILF